MQLPGTAATEDASARANHVQVLGVDETFWQLAESAARFGDLAADAVVLNEALAGAAQSKPGDTILLRIQKPSLLSRDAPLTPQEDFSVALRLKLGSIVSDEQFGRFSLQANQVAPFNAFVNLALLQEKVGQNQTGRTCCLRRQPGGAMSAANSLCSNTGNSPMRNWRCVSCPQSALWNCAATGCFSIHRWWRPRGRW